MKYNIGDLVVDEDGDRGVVVIRWNDGDICSIENDAAHPNPHVYTVSVGMDQAKAVMGGRPAGCLQMGLPACKRGEGW